MRFNARHVGYAVAGVLALALVATGVGLAISSGSGEGAAGGGTGTATHQPATLPPTPTSALVLVDLPHGDAPALPYWSGGLLHLGSREVRTPAPAYLVGGNGTTLVALRRPAGAIDLVLGTALVRLTDEGSYPSLSPDGGLATWEIPGSSHVAVSLWDMTTRTEVARVTTPIENTTCCGGGEAAYPNGVDDAGRVYLGDGNDQWVWDHRSGLLTRLTGLNPHAVYDGIRTFGPVMQDPGRSLADDAPQSSTYAEVDAGGSFRPLGGYPSRSGVWSVDGQRVAYVDEARLAAVTDVSTRRTIRLGLPADVDVNEGELVWESATSVLVAVTRSDPPDQGTIRPGAVLRCDVTSGSCEIASLTAHGSSVELPRPSWRY